MADTKVYLSGERIQGASTDTSGEPDTLGTSANGTLIGDPTGGDTSPTPPTGLGTTSFNFDGNDAIDIDDTEPFSTTVGSISAWFYNDGTSEGKNIVSFGDESAAAYLNLETKTDGIAGHARAASGNLWEIRRAATGGSGNGGALSDAWHHVVLSQNGTAVKMYVDGVYLNGTWDNENDKSKWMETDLDKGRIGCVNRSGSGNIYFHTGNIMEVAMWNVALTQAQVTSLYGNGGSTAKKANTEPTGLKAYYPLSGTVVTNAAVVVDKSKDSITNVPVGTRYEETDTRKIFRRKAASSSVTGVATPTGLGDYCMDMTTNGTVYRCTDVMINPGNYSWSTWFYPSNTTEEMAFFKHWSAGGASTYAAILAMAGSGDGSVFSFTRSGGGGALYGRTAASAVTTGKWNLITVSYQTNDTINIFVNGNDNTNYSGYPTGSAGGCNEVADWAFGASGQAGTPTGTVEDLLGYVCDTASWNVALTYANHQTMWNSYNQNTNVGGALATTVEANQIRGYWSGSNAGGNPVNEATGSASEGSDLDLEQNTGITSAGTTSVAASWVEKGTA